MFLLVYLTVFTAAFILSNLLASYLSNSWRNWQAKRMQGVRAKLDDSFVFIEKKNVIFLSVCPLIFAGAGFFLLPNLLGAIIGAVFGLVFPGLLVGINQTNRIKKLQSQLVDALVILSSSLKGGLSFMQALEVVCEEMSPPISQELGLVLKRNKLGISLDDSLIELRQRVRLEEVNLLVASIIIAKETGGDLTKVLSRLIDTIRNNVKLKERIYTLTLQGKLQGIIMAVLPIFFALYIYKQNPNHFDVMLETQLGKGLLIAAVLAQIIGMYLIKRISTLRI
jgi:tight adherence protein B